MYKLAIILFIIVLFITPRQASAHVLVTDSTGQFGAILHVMPDDDPIAGREGEIFFDIQNDGQDIASAMLTVTAENGEVGRPAVTVKGSSVSANYTFVKHGIYRLRLTAVSSARTLTFDYNQRVARGSGATVPVDTRWGEPVLVAAVTGVVLLTMAAWNRRKSIQASIRRR